MMLLTIPDVSSAWIPVICLGVSMVLIFWWIARRVKHNPEQTGRLRDRLPPDAAGRLDRMSLLQYKVCQATGAVVAPLMPRVYKSQVDRLILRAGLDWLLLPEVVLAAQFLLVAIAMIAAMTLNHFLDLSPLIPVMLCLIAGWWPVSRIAHLGQKRQQRMSRDLPTYLDLLVLAVSGGQSTAAAIAMAVRLGPAGPLADELTRMLREIRAGRPRHEAMNAMGARINLNGVSQATGALIAAERQGADISDVLKAQAEQRRQERFLDAEQRAMKAPVRMLFPLVVFIFPGTFLILMFPVALQLLDSGLL